MAPRVHRMVRISRYTLALSLLLAGLSATAGAEPTSEQWVEQLRQLDAGLRAEQWQESREEAEKLTDRMLKRLGIGPAANYLLALVTTYRALAEAGLGMREEADWHWHVAQALDAQVASADLRPYGRAGELLREELSTLPQDPSKAESSSDSRREIRPPRCRKRTPEFPLSLGLRGYGSRVVVQVIIGRDGRLRQPHLVEGGPGLSKSSRRSKPCASGAVNQACWMGSQCRSTTP